LGALDGKWHAAIDWFDLEFVLRSATAKNFDFHAKPFQIQGSL
jgi:hypothetical protein